MNYIVLGANFGDEGKGSCVSKLISTEKVDYVVRFNGGHQVGHTVVHKNKRHVFSNFGSGTMQGVPTYWSRFCTVHPLGILNEFDVLCQKGWVPILYIDPLCPIVTPFDIARNHKLELNNNHGSVGVGFGTTIERQENYYKLFAQDLLFEGVTREKLRQIAKYYNAPADIVEPSIESFMNNVKELLSINTIFIRKPEIYPTDSLVFEGGQGILLDMDFGFFPHVTRSNTTSKNAFTLLNEWGRNEDVVVRYVTRVYLTRHGYGYLPFECSKDDLGINNPDETNVYNDWQKDFRYAPLNLDLLKYSLTSDNNFSAEAFKIMHVTCADQIDGTQIKVVHDNKLKVCEIADIPNLCGLRGIIQYKP